MADKISKQLHAVERALPLLESEKDFETVERLALECGKAAERFRRWAAILAKAAQGVVDGTAV